MTSLISSEVTIAGEETVAPSVATSPSSLFSTEVSVAEAPLPEAPNVSTAPSSLFSTEVSVAEEGAPEAPAPPTAPPTTTTAPEGKPWGFLLALGALLGILITTRRKKEEEERGR
jgi:hypothetical protein